MLYSMLYSSLEVNSVPIHRLRNAQFLELLSPDQRLGLLKAQAGLANLQESHSGEKCSERFPGFKDGCSEVPCSEDEQSVPTNTQAAENSILQAASSVYGK